jgi:hypothetical protein
VYGSPEALGGVAQQAEGDRRDDRAARQHRAAAEGGLAVLLLLDARVVGGEGDVDRPPTSRLERLAPTSAPPPR